MFKNVVKFILQCVSQGSGFKKSLDDTKALQRQMGELSGAAKKLGTAFGTVGNIAGGLVGNILKGGIWGAAAEGARMLIEKWKDWREYVKQCAIDAAKKVAKSFTDAADTISDRFKKLGDQIKFAGTYAKALLGSKSAKDDLALARENSEADAATRKRLAAAKTAEEKAVIQAEAELAKAKRAEARQIEKSRDERAASDEELRLAKHELAEAEDARERVGEARRYLGNQGNIERKAGNEEQAKIFYDAAKEAGKKASALDKRIDELRQTIDVANVKREEAEAKRTQAEVAAKDAVAKADFDLAEAIKKRKEAEEKRAAEERKKDVEAYNAKVEQGRQFVEMAEAKAKEERKKEADQKLAEEQEKAKEQQKKIGDTIQRLLREIRDIEKARERTRKGMETDHKNHNGLFGPYRYHLDENGNISNFTDWDRANRYAGHDNDEQKAKRRQETDDARMRDIQDRLEAGKYVSEADQKKYDRWRQFKTERDGEEKRKAEIENLQQEQQTAVIKSEKHLKKIKEDLAQFVESGVLQ